MKVPAQIHNLRVRKRDGSQVRFDRNKIQNAVLAAFNAVHPGNIPDISGLVSDIVEVCLLAGKEVLDIEEIQDFVESRLMASSYDAVAKAYILYRQKRAEERASIGAPDPEAVETYIHLAKYARLNRQAGRRENYEETVGRVEEMHLRRFNLTEDRLHTVPGGSEDELRRRIRSSFDVVRGKRALASMRSMQFGGRAIETNNTRMYNCSFSLADRPRFFQELFHNLLSGSGCGYSVQWHHVEKLPEMARVDEHEVRHYEIPDSIEGWSQSVGVLIKAHILGRYVEFNYGRIRDHGLELVTSGGKAPGHLPLKRLHEKMRALLAEASGRKLRPFEVHRLCCFIAEAVLSGGIRRSSLISLFSPDDGEMLYCKTGSRWPTQHPELSMANNSAVLLRHGSGATTFEQFKRIVSLSRQWGEPGFYFTEDLNYGCNPCGEIGLNPIIESSSELGINVGKFVADEAFGLNPNELGFTDFVEDWGAMGPGYELTGWSFCNLTEINAARCQTRQDFMEAAEAAAIIGTLQASYTNFMYLGPITRAIVERESLLGVGITGIMDNPKMALDPQILRDAADLVNRVNEATSELLGISPAARTTTIKPSGTASLELGCVGSGIHPHHAKRYFRRVTANPAEVVAQEFRRVNPHMVEQKPNGDWSIVFPVQAPTDAITTGGLKGLNFIDHVFTVYDNWIKTGTRNPSSSPGLTHNVSCTVVVHDDEWDLVIQKVWDNRQRINAMSFLPVVADKLYAYAPREAVSTPADEARWQSLIANYRRVDWSLLRESVDETSHVNEPACAGGSCEI